MDLRKPYPRNVSEEMPAFDCCGRYGEAAEWNEMIMQALKSTSWTEVLVIVFIIIWLWTIFLTSYVYCINMISSSYY